MECWGDKIGHEAANAGAYLNEVSNVIFTSLTLLVELRIYNVVKYN